MTIGFMIALMQGLAGEEQGPASVTAPVRRVHGRWRMQNETVAPIGKGGMGVLPVPGGVPARVVRVETGTPPLNGGRLTCSGDLQSHTC